MADPAAERVSMVMATLGSVAETVVRSPRSTVEPPRDVAHGKRALEVLRGLTHDPRELLDEGVLGEGGMGVVKLARQVALDRQVAVKTLKHASEDASEALLSEALLAGSLEHPGIMPIYALSLDAAGRPVLVMRRIEGVTWAALLSGEGSLPSFATGPSRLEAHLRVVMQLCNAVHFAHSRGVVHRDLKPANVMLGHYGEVYLMDWGIATREGPSEQFAGTPAYMAPEMVGGADARISPRTDVYLLGAVLAELVTGRPPHLKDSVPAMLESVLRASVVLPADVPTELAELVARCTSARPDDRPESALHVRRALEDFLEHQGSRELARQAEERAQALEPLMNSAAPDPVQVNRFFTECRFALQQALRAWPGNAEASQSLERITARMVRFELAHGSWRTAKTLLAELPSPPAALLDEVRRCEETERAKADELARLQRIAKSLDPLTGARRRVVLAMVLGVLWVVGPAIRHFTGPVLIADDLLASVPVAIVSIVIILVVSARTKAQFRTPLNQQVARLLVAAMTMQIVTAMGLVLGLGVSLGELSAAALIWFWALIAGLIGTLLVRQVWPAVASYALGTVGAVTWPRYGNLFGSLANLGLYLNLVGLYVWQKRALARRASEQPGQGEPDDG